MGHDLLNGAFGFWELVVLAQDFGDLFTLLAEFDDLGGTKIFCKRQRYEHRQQNYDFLHLFVPYF
jgi:hypothetical protein